jgi:hypothetical protein
VITSKAILAVLSVSVPGISRSRYEGMGLKVRLLSRRAIRTNGVVMILAASSATAFAVPFENILSLHNYLLFARCTTEGSRLRHPEVDAAMPPRYLGINIERNVIRIPAR